MIPPSIVVICAALLAVLKFVTGCPEVCDFNQQTSHLCSCNNKSLTSIPVTTTDVVRLSFRRNHVPSLISKVFQDAGYSKVVVLDLASSEISDVASDAFYGLVRVLRIDLSSNNIVTVSKDTFARLPTIESISLSDNPLTAITGTANVASRNLEFLGLSRCNISNLEDIFRSPSDEDVSWIDTLTHVQLHDNKISCISDEMVAMINKTRIFTLASNPLRPSCVSLRFDELLTDTDIELEDWRQNAGA